MLFYTQLSGSFEIACHVRVEIRQRKLQTWYGESARIHPQDVQQLSGSSQQLAASSARQWLAMTPSPGPPPSRTGKPRQKQNCARCGADEAEVCCLLCNRQVCTERCWAGDHIEVCWACLTECGRTTAVSRRLSSPSFGTTAGCGEGATICSQIPPSTWTPAVLQGNTDVCVKPGTELTAQAPVSSVDGEVPKDTHFGHPAEDFGCDL